MGGHDRKGKREARLLWMPLCATELFILPPWEEQEHILSKCILSSEIVAYEDLGTEAVRRLAIQDFPVVVVMDALGNNLYETAVKGILYSVARDMKRIIYMVLMNLLHAPIWFSPFRVWQEKKIQRTAAEKYGVYIGDGKEGLTEGAGLRSLQREQSIFRLRTDLYCFPIIQGLFDMFALFSTCPRPLVCCNKERGLQLDSGRSRVLGATKSLTMDRDDIKDQVRIITEVTKRVKSGRNFVIFAEGHPDYNGNEILDFKSGTFKGAVKNGCSALYLWPWLIPSVPLT